jgi:hypothetical protein
MIVGQVFQDARHFGIRLDLVDTYRMGPAFTLLAATLAFFHPTMKIRLELAYRGSGWIPKKERIKYILAGKVVQSLICGPVVIRFHQKASLEMN